MGKFSIEFYETEQGDIPVEQFLLSLDKTMRAKLLGIMEILQEKGNLLREPYSKHLEDGIFELRGKVGTDISRALYFFARDGRIIFTNGFVKKTQKVPVAELKRAKKYRKDYRERCERHEKG